MALIDAAVAFATSLLIGSLAIHIAARLIVGETRFGEAVFTALIGALVWGAATLLFGFIPVLGPLIALIAWIAVINWQYPGGWIDSAILGLVAWVSALIVIYLLTLLGVGSLAALGIPGA